MAKKSPQITQAVLVSVKAAERAKRDVRVRNKMKRYIDEIAMIARDPINRRREIIGDFNVSPRGRGGDGIRIAWGYQFETGTLRVFDFLYHKTGDGYVDDWANKACDGIIGIEYYEKFVSLKDFVYSPLFQGK